MNDTMTPPRTQPELVRPHDSRVIAGVAAALSRRLDVGTGWIRLAFVVTSFFGGLGILLYLVGWLVIRGESEPVSIAERWIGDFEGTSAWVGLGLIVVAGMVILGASNIVRGELIFAAGLFLAGVLLYRGDLPRTRSQDPQHAASVVAAESGGTDAAIDLDRPDAGSPTPPTAPPPATLDAVAPPPPPARPPRQPSYLGRIVVAASLILIGTIAVLDNLDVIDPSLRHYVAGIVLMVGLGLLVGTVAGRARWLIVVGLLATPVLFASAAIRVPLSGEWGDREFVPVTATELQTSYQLAGGQLVLDLRRLGPVVDGTTVSADVGIGQLTVIIPAAADFDVIGDASVGIGALVVLGSEQGGLGVDDRFVFDSGADLPDLQLQLDMGIGEIDVRVES